MTQDPDQQKATAIDFYRMAYEGNPAKAVEVICG